jgi:cyclic pyranopterin phosphate synthase
MGKLTHTDGEGKARMVDVSEKKESLRKAVAEATVRMSAETLEAVGEGKTPKGDVLATARLSGIAAAKKTSDLIPLCHPLRLTDVNVELKLDPENRCVEIRAEATAFDRTGVEMEAMTAAAVAALTLYDMCKGIERGIEITAVRLLEKSGGRSGHWTRSGSGT